MIEVVVYPTGETRIQTKGFLGSSCLAASRFLEGALGKRVADRLTSEFYIASALAETAHQRSVAHHGQAGAP
jgi:hypothetical protein